MNWTTKGVAALVAGTALFCGMGTVTAVALTGHHGTAPAAPVQPQFTNSVAVVSQFYQDITDHNYVAAWALGGKYIGGQDYSSWVAGYSTTASVSLYSFSDWGSGKVTTYLSALQSDGTTRTYYGTYYVSNGVIISASIAQTS
jgi:hypothetical protein